MVLSEVATEEEVTPVESFFWFFQEGEFEWGEGHQATVQLNIDDVQWFPSGKFSALSWFHLSPNAAGLRSREGHFYLLSIKNRDWQTTKSGGEGAEEPEDWKYSPDLFDYSEEIDLEPDFQGYNLKGPISVELDATVQNNRVTTDVRNVSGIQTHMMSPHYIRQLSGKVVLTAEELLTETADQTPIINGVLDNRMGSYDASACGTCGQARDDRSSKNSCPGHFGRIELEVPVPNFAYLGGKKQPLDSSPLMFTLNSICIHCNRVRLPEDAISELEEYTTGLSEKVGSTAAFQMVRKRLNTLFSQVGQSGPGPHTCPHCDQKTPVFKFKYTFGGPRFKFAPTNDPRADYTGTNFFPRVPFSYSQVYNWFRNIPDKDARAIGFDTTVGNRPEFMFWEALPVIPIPSRPPMESPGGAIIPDDLTVLYQNIIKVNNYLRSQSHDRGRVENLASKLFLACTQLASGQIDAIGAGFTRTGFSGSGTQRMASRGLYDRINGVSDKKNRVRALTQSKVTEHSMYSVITPNPSLRVDQVGIPIQTCMTLTVKETVTKENIRNLREYLRKGTPFESATYFKESMLKRYPGALKFEKFHWVVQGQNSPIELKDLPLASNGYQKWNTDKGEYELETEDSRGWYQEWTSIEQNRRQELREDEIIRGYPYKDVNAIIAREKKTFLKRKNDEFRIDMAKELAVGDVVHRHLVEGDLIVFTRAPALHRQSLAAFRVVPLKQKSISFNPTVCLPFNADYDGDAVRCYVPQSDEARAEAEELLTIENQMLHSRMGSAAIAADQDETSGAYLLTYENVDQAGKYQPNAGVGYDENGVIYFTKQRMMKLLSLAFASEDGLSGITDIGEPDGMTETVYYSQTYIEQGLDDNGKQVRKPSPKRVKYEPEPYYTGRHIVSLFIPEGINVVGDGFRIDNGVLTGVFDKSAIAAFHTPIASAFAYRFGYKEGMKKMMYFIDQFTRLCFAAHIHVGFTMGIDDLSIPRHKTVQFRGEQTPFYSAIDTLYEEANQKYQHTLELFWERRLEDLDGLDNEEKRRILLDAPLLSDLRIQEITDEFEDEVLRLTKSAQSSSNSLAIQVKSGARASDGNILQMSGAYGQMRVGGVRVISGINNNRLLQHKPRFLVSKPPEGNLEEMSEEEREQYWESEEFQAWLEEDTKGNFRGEAFGLIKDSYATGLEPTDYFLASIAGRKVTYESSMGAIQESGHLSHKLKRGMENLMVNEQGQVVELRSNQICSFSVGEDGLRPFHARDADNIKHGYTLSLQPVLLDFKCVHGLTLYDECDTCQKGTPTFKRRKLNPLSGDARDQIFKLAEKRVIADPEGFASAIRAYALDSQVQPGEMIGSTGAANFGEPATQAGLRAFHGGGKGTTPTVSGLRQLLEMVEKKRTQPMTHVFLKDEYDTQENADKLAGWCTRLTLDKVMKESHYDAQNGHLRVKLDTEPLELFSVAYDHIVDKVKSKLQKYRVVLQTPEYGVLDIQARNTDPRTLVLIKNTLQTINIGGIRNSEQAFAVKKKHPATGKKHWCVAIQGPLTGAKLSETNQYPYLESNPSPTLWDDLHLYLDKYIDPTLSMTNDPWSIYALFGLEAMLTNIVDLIWEQMHGSEDAKGLGTLDYRYIRTAVDAMGIKGTPIGLGPTGTMVKWNQSLIGALGGENLMPSIQAHTIMGSHDSLKGMVEQVAIGKRLEIGREYRQSL